MNYCGACGARVVSKWFDADNRARYVCTRCEKIHFENPKILVACLAHSAGRIVMCRRAHAPAAGLWVPPSGFVEMGETLEAAAAREAAEEAGLKVNTTDLIPCAITSLPHLSEIYITFRVAVAKPELTPGAESLDVALFDENEVPWKELAFPGTQNFLRIFFQELRSGQFSLHLGMTNATDRARRAYRLSNAGDVP